MIVSHLHPTSCTAKIELVGRVVVFVFMFEMIIACTMIPCQSSSDILWLHLLYEQISYCIACVYNPPRPRYQPQALTDAIVTGLDSFLATNCNSGIGSTIFIAGDFNSYDGSWMETQYGLVQVVDAVTHGSNILDQVYTNRSDIYHAVVSKSLII